MPLLFREQGPISNRWIDKLVARLGGNAATH